MNNKKTLSVDQLEDRRLMTVTAMEIGEDLYINGDGSSDMIQVYQLSNGDVRIAGIAGSGTTVNGQSQAQFEVNDDIYIDLGNGDNWLDIRNNNGGVDADYVRIRSGNGNDRLWVSGINTTNDLRFETRGGNDDILVAGSQIGNGSGDDLRVYSGSGEDTVRVQMTNVRQDIDIDTFDSTSTANEEDEVNIQSTNAHDDIWIDTGSGNDDVFLRDVESGDDTRIRTGAGNDYVFVNAVSKFGDDFSAYMGSGNDTLGVYQTDIGDDARFDAGTGLNDRLYTWQLDVNGQTTEVGWDAITRY
ncbi:hypothetical protein ACFL2H_10335 [Planctomycetota bacterium]